MFMPDPKTWFARVMGGPGIREAPLTPEIAIDASFLPGELHGDPGDRLLVATARYLGLPIVTRDRSIIAYAGDGHARVIPC
jgi:PIN domain nuclease of toxin-antitoxin system